MVDEAEEEVSAQLLRGLDLKEDVDEDLETGKVNVLRGRWIRRVKQSSAGTMFVTPNSVPM